MITKTGCIDHEATSFTAVKENCLFIAISTYIHPSDADGRLPTPNKSKVINHKNIKYIASNRIHSNLDVLQTLPLQTPAQTKLCFIGVG